MIKMTERFPKVRIILDHMARRCWKTDRLCGGRQPVRSRPLSVGLSQADAAQLHRIPQRQGDAESFFAKLVAAFGAQRLAWARTIPPRKARCRAARAGEELVASLPQGDQDWIFGKTPRPLSCSGQVTERTAVTNRDKPTLHTMLGNYPNTQALKKGEIRSDLVDFDFAE